jgi:hypothetical protein
VLTGRRIALLDQGHYGVVMAAVFCETTGQLWTAGFDGALLVWEPRCGNDLCSSSWSASAVSPATRPELTAAAGTAGSRSTPLDPDWWLAAATGRRRQQQQQQATTAQRSERRVALDVDNWTDEEGDCG